MPKELVNLLVFEEAKTRLNKIATERALRHPEFRGEEGRTHVSYHEGRTIVTVDIAQRDYRVVLDMMEGFLRAQRVDRRWWQRLM